MDGTSRFVGKLELEIYSHVADNVDENNEDLQKGEEQPTDDINVNFLPHFSEMIGFYLLAISLPVICPMLMSL